MGGDRIRWYIDGQLYMTGKRTALQSDMRWVFDHPFFLILFLGVGGVAGPPNFETSFPQQLVVDYVKVWGP